MSSSQQQFDNSGKDNVSVTNGETNNLKLPCVNEIETRTASDPKASSLQSEIDEKNTVESNNLEELPSNEAVKNCGATETDISPDNQITDKTNDLEEPSASQSSVEEQPVENDIVAEKTVESNDLEELPPDEGVENCDATETDIPLDNKIADKTDETLNIERKEDRLKGQGQLHTLNIDTDNINSPSTKQSTNTVTTELNLSKCSKTNDLEEPSASQSSVEEQPVENDIVAEKTAKSNDLEELPPDEGVENCDVTETDIPLDNKIADKTLDETLNNDKKEVKGQGHSHPEKTDTDNCGTQCPPHSENNNTEGTNNINTEQLTEAVTTELNGEGFEKENKLNTSSNRSDTKAEERNVHSDIGTDKDSQPVKSNTFFYSRGDFYSEQSDPDCNNSENGEEPMDTNLENEKDGCDDSENVKEESDKEMGKKLTKLTQKSSEDVEGNKEPSKDVKEKKKKGTEQKGKKDERKKDKRPYSFRRSWSDKDTEEYRRGYPGKLDDDKADKNLRFYQNKLESYPDGDYIDTIHKEWKGNYGLLERHHGYIQWLFPIRERGMNWHAQELQLHEAQAIQEDCKSLERVCKSYELMLDFYGMKLVDKESGRLTRADNWEERFDHLNWSFHNYLRITRILKSLGELGYERYQAPFVEFILDEAYVKERLNGRVLSSCTDYWVGTVKDEKERKKLLDRIYEHDWP
ncbi:cylicin-1-like isoform X2 [Gigantopelta aegis]|uniref:cylicin-1-like isoform X2 n=1 Tax=Gigantopelta aegis TaxID=1735272 RepID=UPI001B88CD4F|nr:cylicin-1-like isoform X2 [Gigantopelta aegis]